MKTFVFFVLFTICTCAKLPASFKKCKKNDSDCLSNAVYDALKQLEKPFKEVNLPSLEPLEIPALTIGAGTGAVGVVQDFKNVKLYGFTKPENTKFEVDAEKKLTRLTTYFPQIKMVADYDINGKILLLPVYGNGPSTLTLEKLDAEQWFQMEEYEKKGKKYWRITDSKLTLKPALVTFNLENLFNGDKTLGDNINKVLNDNWQDVFRDVQDNYEDAFGQIAKSVFNNLLAKVPLDELFDE